MRVVFDSVSDLHRTWPRLLATDILFKLLAFALLTPLVGFALTKIFHFEPEIAAGIILIGSCSAGLASNVMAYIALDGSYVWATCRHMETAEPIGFDLLAGRPGGSRRSVRSRHPGQPAAGDRPARSGR